MLGQQLPDTQFGKKVREQKNMNMVIPQETPMGLKLQNPSTKETRLLHFQNRQLIMDWNEFLRKKQEGEHLNLKFTVKGDYLPLIVSGNNEQLSLVYNYCVGKYIFSKGTSFILIKNIKMEKDYQLQKVYNKDDGRIYYEKMLLQESLQNLDQSSYSNKTEYIENVIPEEILIILDLHRAHTPHLLRVNSIFYNGVHYSYIYSKKDIIELIQYFKGAQQDQNCLIIIIAKQLLELLIVLEEKQLIFPSINLKNIYINPTTLEIMLMDYSQAFYLNDLTQDRRNATFGYAPPEYFQQGIKTSTKANVYQVGVILFHLLFGQCPYGLDPQEIVKNTLQKTPNLAVLKCSVSPLTNFIQQLLESDPKKRPTAKVLLSNCIFTPAILQKFSKMSLILKQKQDINQVESIEEFPEFNSISNVQKVRSMIKKKN